MTIQLTNGKISNTEVVQDNINMFYHEYDALLNNVLQEFAPDFNNHNKDGWDMSSKMPAWALELSETLITPYVQDSFLFAAGHYKHWSLKEDKSL